MLSVHEIPWLLNLLSYLRRYELITLSGPSILNFDFLLCSSVEYDIPFMLYGKCDPNWIIKYVLSSSIFSGLYHEGMLDFVKGFSAFLSLSPFMWFTTFIELYIKLFLHFRDKDNLIKLDNCFVMPVCSDYKCFIDVEIPNYSL